jgi:hypothetical protein
LFAVGLTIIFLVLYNYKWNQINASRIIVGLSLFTLLFYQSARFFSGIAIALFFAYYIQKLIIKRMQVNKASLIANTGEQTVSEP